MVLGVNPVKCGNFEEGCLYFLALVQLDSCILIHVASMYLYTLHYRFHTVSLFKQNLSCYCLLTVFKSSLLIYIHLVYDVTVNTERISKITGIMIKFKGIMLTNNMCPHL